MENKIQNYILDLIKIVEIIFAIVLMITILIVGGKEVVDIFNMVKAGISIEAFDKILANIFTLIIGVEFVKMICKYTPDTVVEVLLFTVARYLVVNHSSAINTLLGIVAIVCIFAIKKYLFFQQEKEYSEKITN